MGEVKARKDSTKKINSFKMGTEGIEPPSAALEAAILPVYYAPLKLTQIFCF